jgi:hypothetical protein
LVNIKNTTHFVYITTIPKELDSVQEEFGIHEKGSFVTSVRNPAFESPPYARLPKDATYSKEIQDEFENYRWVPLKPKHLNYDFCQFLLIGEKKDALPSEGGKEGVSAAAEDDLKELEDEDHNRAEHLKEDNIIYADLKLDAKDYPEVLTEW